jgi:hypothetical protein
MFLKNWKVGSGNSDGYAPIYFNCSMHIGPTLGATYNSFQMYSLAPPPPSPMELSTSIWYKDAPYSDSINFVPEIHIWRYRLQI